MTGSSFIALPTEMTADDMEPLHTGGPGLIEFILTLHYFYFFSKRHPETFTRGLSQKFYCLLILR